MFRDNGRPTTETIPNRPLQGRAIPDGCWRPWDLDLDPRCLESTGDCPLRMLEACHCNFYAGRAVNNAAFQSEAGETREKLRSGDISTRAERRAKDAGVPVIMDAMFAELNVVGECPYEKGWREEGVTSAMRHAPALRRKT
jgi:hypothetical protein